MACFAATAFVPCSTQQIFSVKARSNRTPRCCTNSDNVDPPPKPRWRTLSAAGATVLALALGFPPRASAGGPVKLTEQVANFTLPSREANSNHGARNGIATRAIGVVKRVAPIAGGVGLAVWLVGKMLRRAREKQLRDFQAQLQSFSSMLDIDTAALDGASSTKTSRKDAKDTANMARGVLERGRYQFRENESRNEDLESKVRLDLFRAGKGSKAKVASDVSNGQKEAADIGPKDEFEAAVAACLAEIAVSPGDSSVVQAAVKRLDGVRDAQGMGKEDAVDTFNAYVSRVVSMQIDRVAVHLDSDDRDSLKNLHALASTMTASQAVVLEEGRTSGLKYVGVHAGEDQTKTREELYKRYAVFCLSSEERIRDDLQSLADMQTLLAVSDARAELINKEIAKGMFQVAVSAAMADGGLDEGSKDSLEKLKESFGNFLDGNAADSIVSEVAVMRAMYSLQELLQEQGVSEEDVSELRRMCGELGVNLDEMLQNADALGNVLGPKAKEFVVSLRDLIYDGEATRKSAVENSVLTTAVNVDSTTMDAKKSPAKGPPDAPAVPGAGGE